MDAAEPQRERQLDILRSGGPGPQEWHAWCRTCGWEVHATGDNTAAKAAAGAHRCPTAETAQSSE